MSQHYTSYRNIAVSRPKKSDRDDSEPGEPETARQNAGLTHQQSADLDSLLAKFDADQFNTADAQALVAGIMDLGIKPSRALGEALRRAGFDPFELAQKGNAKARSKAASGAPIGRRGQVNLEALDALSRLVEKYSETDLAPDDWTTLFAELEAKGYDMSRPLVDIRL